MKIALVDDEQSYLDELAQLCHDFGVQNNYAIETVPFTNAETFLNAFERGSFSVVFMDIYMDDMNGVTAALRMRSLDPQCVLVFVTSSADFMPEAFSCHAFEYVTKPFSSQRIAAILRDVSALLPMPSKYVEVPSDRKTVPIFIHEIVSVITDAHYIHISLTNGTCIKTRMTLTAFLQLTENDARFITVNKGVAINAEYITDFGDNCCILENGRYFPIRVRDRLKIEQAVQDYHFSSIRQCQAMHRRVP